MSRPASRGSQDAFELGLKVILSFSRARFHFLFYDSDFLFSLLFALQLIDMPM